MLDADAALAAGGAAAAESGSALGSSMDEASTHVAAVGDSALETEESIAGAGVVAAGAGSEIDTAMDGSAGKSVLLKDAAEDSGGALLGAGAAGTTAGRNISTGLEEASSKTSGLKKGLSSLGEGTLVALVGIGAESVHLADSFDQATDKIAADAGIPDAAAGKISASFLKSTGVGVDSGAQLAAAYATEAGVLDQTQGHVLSAAQAHQVMASSEDLAAASGEDLNTATADLAQTMQAYDLKADQSATTATILDNTSHLTGQTVDTVEGSFLKLRSTLGAVAPNRGDTAGFFDDLTEHGETGRKALSATNTAFTDLLKTSSAVPATEAQVKAAFDSLPLLRATAGEGGPGRHHQFQGSEDGP